MTFPAITSLLAICISFLVIYFILKIANVRRTERVELQTKGNDRLERVVRSHGNLVETAPIFIIMLALCEMAGANSIAVAVFALIFLISRLMHPIGLSGKDGTFKLRVYGMFLTITAYILTAAYLAYALIFMI